ncbi:MAG TPA: hypothetical protein VMA37_01525 [Acetobacteraceae bacterium]|nr:hypothetical protein [Acetobacteraceae bacterium]
MSVANLTLDDTGVAMKGRGSPVSTYQCYVILADAMRALADKGTQDALEVLIAATATVTSTDDDVKLAALSTIFRAQNEAIRQPEAIGAASDAIDLPAMGERGLLAKSEILCRLIAKSEMIGSSDVKTMLASSLLRDFVRRIAP